MNITSAHLQYWRERQPLPRWAAPLVEADKKRLWKVGRGMTPTHQITIDHIVNVNAQDKPRRTLDYLMAAHNLLNLLKPRRWEKEDVTIRLARMASDPGTVCSPELRARYAKKWLKGVLRSRSRAEMLKSPRYYTVNSEGRIVERERALV